MRRAVPERPPPRGGERQHRAEREDVRRLPHLPPHGLLGGHEGGGAQHRPGHRQRRTAVVLQGLGDPEVDDPRPVVQEQHIRRLQVAVHQPHAVERLQCFGQSRGQLPQRRLVQRPVRRHLLRQRGTRNVLTGHPGRRRVRVGVHHGSRPEAARLHRQLDLPPEPPAEAGVLGDLGPYELHGDPPPRTGLAQIHLPHTAGPEPGPQSVRTDRHRVFGTQWLWHCSLP